MMKNLWFLLLFIGCGDSGNDPAPASPEQSIIELSFDRPAQYFNEEAIRGLNGNFEGAVPKSSYSDLFSFDTSKKLRMTKIKSTFLNIELGIEEHYQVIESLDIPTDLDENNINTKYADHLFNISYSLSTRNIQEGERIDFVGSDVPLEYTKSSGSYRFKRSFMHSGIIRFVPSNSVVDSFETNVDLGTNTVVTEDDFDISVKGLNRLDFYKVGSKFYIAEYTLHEASDGSSKYRKETIYEYQLVEGN